MTKIVGALRTYSRNDENDPFISCHLDNILEETVHLCGENLRSSGVELKVTGEKGILLEVRPVQISQVLVNLVNNSADAVQGLAEKWVTIHTEREASGKIRISVTDGGKGIPPAIAEKMLQPFFTTKEIGKGTGLGLSVSKGIIENHEGVIFYDAASANTRFVVELPMKHSQALSRAA